MIGICPRCNQRYSYNKYDSDYVHQCNSGIAALDQEDVLEIDNAQWNFLGAANKLGGENVGTPDAEDVESVTPRGARESTHRQRQHDEYIKLK